MKEKDISQHVMQEVVHWEMNVVKRVLLMFGMLFIVFFVSGTFLLLTMRTILSEQESFAPLELFQEDPEVIKDFLPEVVDTFWEEVPKIELLFLSFILAAAGTTYVMYYHRKRELAKRAENVYRYVNEKGGHMNEESQKTNLTPYAIIGLLLVLVLLAVYPKLSQKQTTKPTKPVTVDNEFAQPVASNRATTPEEKVAQQKFTFTLTSPQNGSTISSATVIVKGKTVPNADVFVNEVDSKADSQGNFSVNYPLEEGDNYLIVGANDQYGNFSEQELTVYFGG